MFVMKYIVFIYFFLYSYVSFGQKETALKHITALSSPQMYGRGYVHNGVGVAADYIDSCFYSYKLQTCKTLEGYRQRVTFNVNMFPGIVTLCINDTIDLTPGLDFIIASNSPAAKYKTDNIVKTTKLQIAQGKLSDVSLRNSILVLDERLCNVTNERIEEVTKGFQALRYQKNEFKAVVEISNKKLTWDVSERVGTFPYFYVNSARVPTTISSIPYHVEQSYIPKYTTYNICGFVPGTVYPDSLIVITAHYDHLGMMGSKTMFPGANDNASGVAMMLTLAEYYAKHPPHKTIVFIALTGEEVGLQGSFACVQNPPFPLNKVNFLINIDLAGTGDEGIQIVNSTIYKQKAAIIDSLNALHTYMPAIKKRGEACNSDHCPFYMKGVPSFFIYTLGGIQAYHDIFDKPETLPLTRFNEYNALLKQFIENL
mgnify:CR=1 FL=1